MKSMKSLRIMVGLRILISKQTLPTGYGWKGLL